MKKFTLFLLSMVGAFALSCAETPAVDPNTNSDENKPTIAIEAGETTDTSITFDIELSNATQAGYVILKSDDIADDSFDAVKVFANGVKLEKAESQSVTLSELEVETAYTIVAFALNGEMKNIDDIVVTAPLEVSTTAVPDAPKPTVEIESLGSTTSSITFKLTPKNNPFECCYKVYRMTPDFKEKDSSDVKDNAKYMTTTAMENPVVIENLLDDQTYVVYALAIAADYQYELSRLEIKTKALDPPTTDIAKQKFEVDTLLVSSIRMFNVKFSNESYKLDMLLQSDYYFKPLIPVGTYIMEKGTAPGEVGYIRDSEVSLVSALTNEEIPLHKGSVEVTLTDGVYSFDGHFITEANELIEYSASSEIVYPLDYRGCSALLYPDTNILEQENGNDFFRLEMHLAEGETIESGTYSIANGKLLPSSCIATRFGGNDRAEVIELKALEVVFSLRDSDDDNELKYTGTATTVEGYEIQIVGDPYVDVTKKPKEELPTLDIKAVEVLSWYFGDYPAGWYSVRYSFDCEVEGFAAFCFEVDAGLFADAAVMLKDGTYGYNESAGPMLEIFFKRDGGSLLYFQDEGGVTIKKLENGEYEMSIELYEMGEERAFTATFKGEINFGQWVG